MENLGRFSKKQISIRQNKLEQRKFPQTFEHKFSKDDTTALISYSTLKKKNAMPN